MKLNELLLNINAVSIKGNTDIHIDFICFDSRQANENCLYIAQQGTKSDGHDFIDDCIAKGASAIVCEILPKMINENVVYIQVQDSAEALGKLSSAFYDFPSEQLHLIGITGTNGKTTTVSLLHKLFRLMDIPCGMLSTVENKINDKIIPSTHTTPDSIALNKLLADMVNEGCEYCFMEVSSHSVVQKRIAGLKFKGGVFSNLTHDHLDYHKTFESYLKAKKTFFDNLNSSAFALTNIDDKNGDVMLQNSKAQKYSYSVKTLADFKCKILENSFDGLHLIINDHEVWFSIVGQFNAYNILAVYSVACLLGFDSLEVLEKMSGLKPAEGRFESLANPQDIVAIVDYAHTPDALKNVLEAIHDIRTGTERVITVVGCGGNRDAEKRPIMALIAYEMSEITILTSDNPRFEEPLDILEQMKKGIPSYSNKKVLVIENRHEAIKTACLIANKGDIVLVAGKGHEKYQEIKGVKTHFDDKEELLNALTI